MAEKELLLRLEPHGTEAVIDAVSGLADQIAEMRKELASYASELRSVREGDVAGLRLQIKGLWSTLGLVFGALLSYAFSHLR